MPPQRRILSGILLLMIITCASYTTVFYSYLLLPKEQHLSVGDTINLPGVPSELLRSVSVQVEGANNQPAINGRPLENKDFLFRDQPAVVTSPGQLNLRLKVFGFIPLKNMMVSILPPVRVIPGGHSVGVILETDGVMVVGHSVVFDEDGKPIYPAKDAGVELGDLLLKINGVKIKNDKHAAELISRFGPQGKMTIELKHSGQLKEVEVIPRFCPETKTYRIGLYIRDNAAGVGTLTFYEPKEKTYGALGHMIIDLDVRSGEEGKIVRADIQGLKPGKKGEPGEKIALFVGDKLTGDIKHNSTFGIFGQLDRPLSNPIYKNGLPVAFASQINEGPAEIVTVISGERLEKFQINILKILPQHHPTGKGLVIQITDKRLLQETGGIIQGMSGSPIIQNGKLVGAVTHVFVNDPTKGYGCLAEWMLIEAGLLKKQASLPKMPSNPPFYQSNLSKEIYHFLTG